MNINVGAFRRTLAVGAVWATAMGGLLATSPAASGQEAVEPGLGNAFAQGVKVDPRTGSLSFGITYGLALSGHQNTVAIAEARSADLGVIGTTLAGEGCDGGDPTLPKEDQPQPLVVRSTEENSDQEQVESENGVEKRARATSAPLAQATAITAGGGEPGAIEIGSSRSSTESGIIDGARVARAITEVGSLSLAGGQVVLRGMTWQASYQTAPTEVTSGSFTIDGIEVAGQTLPIPEDNPLAPLEQANVVLEPLGFRISPPTVRNEAGIQFVDPMRISVVPSETRESVLGPIFNTVQPVRESLFDALIEADCGNAAYITVLDIVLNSVTGAGSLGIELGGVRASSDEIEFSSFLGGLPGGGLPPASPGIAPIRSASGSTSVGSSASSPTGGGAFAAPSATGAPAPSATGTNSTDTGATDEQAIVDIEPISGSRGGPLAAVGLGGLALLFTLAAADRAKMRRAQRSVLMEAF